MQVILKVHLKLNQLQPRMTPDTVLTVVVAMEPNRSGLASMLKEHQGTFDQTISTQIPLTCWLQLSTIPMVICECGKCFNPIIKGTRCLLFMKEEDLCVILIFPDINKSRNS